MELNIYFKNVGQGDTIIMDWQDPILSGIKKFGMIDCNMHDNGILNILDHIQKNNIRKFEFVIMTHPHSDHFSGFLMFFEFCHTEGIVIEKFIHTAYFDPSYLSTILKKGLTTKAEQKKEMTLSVNRDEHKTILWNIYSRLKKQHHLENGFIKNIKILTADARDIELFDDIKMRLLSPENYDEMAIFFKRTYKAEGKELETITRKLENNPHGNYLASFLQIYSEKSNWQVLLCSDVTKDTLNRIMNDENIFKSLKEKTLLAAQIPHHGSEKNHIENFWSQLKGIKDADIIISVGDGYGHPHSSVVKYFNENFRSVHATNFVGGYKIYFNRLTSSIKFRKVASIMDLPGISVNYNIKKNPIIDGLPKCCEKSLQISVSENGNPTCEVIDNWP